YVVNETFVKKSFLGKPKEALGTVITQNNNTAEIVAVVNDFNDHSPKEEISPLLIYQRYSYNRMAIKIGTKQIMPVTKEIENMWTATFPEGVYSQVFLNDDIDKFYKGEQIMGVLFRGFAGLIIFI